MKKIILSVFALRILLPTLAFASFDISLKYGSRGEAVIELQDFLQEEFLAHFDLHRMHFSLFQSFAHLLP